jgi:hypothetical protein
MGEIAKAFSDAVFAAFDPVERAPKDSHAADYERALVRALGDAIEAILKADGPGRHFHFHPPEGSILAAEGESVLIEPIESASARLAAGVSVQTVAAGTVNTEGETVLSMLMLTGELGGKSKDETCSAYLRRLLDFVASFDPGQIARQEWVMERTLGADGTVTPQKPLDLADLG